MLQLKQRFGPWSFYRNVLVVALPVMTQQFIMSMVSLIDNFMVAGLGDVSMAAVNVTNHLFFVYFVLINVTCQAGGIYIAQFKGANDNEGMKHAFRFKVIFATAIAMLAFIVSRSLTNPLIAMMTTANISQQEIVSVGSRYLKLISWTFLPTAISSAIGTSFRDTARPKIPLIISIFATLINTTGNWILIYGNLGAPRLEVEGAAIATIIARLFELCVFVIYSTWDRAPFFVIRIFNIHKKLIKEILYKSSMIFVSEISWISSETIMIAMYNRRGGAEVVAGMAAGWTIANLFFILFGGIYTASAILIGGTLGSGQLDEARRRSVWLKSGSVVAGIIMALPSAIVSFFLVPLVFSNLSAEARANCLGLVYVILAYLPLWGLLNTQFAISRAGGDTAMGMYADLSVNTVLFAPGAFLLSYLTTIAPVPMLAILKTSDIAKYLICRHLMRKEKWVRNLAYGKGVQ